MKKLYSLVLSLTFITCFAQEQFSFTMYIEDAAGNQDSLIIGYDSLATDSIDVAFGEVDLHQVPWDLPFDARAGNLDNQWSWGDTTEWLTEKSIVPPNGGVKIEVKCSNFPIEVTWNTADFPVPSDIEGSHMWYPYVTDLSNLMTLGGSVILDEFSLDQYQNYHGDTIHFFYFQFCDVSCSGVSVSENDVASIDLYPNPANNVLTLGGVDNVSQVEVIDLLGKTLQFPMLGGRNLDVSGLPVGYYWLRVGEEKVPFVISR